MKNIYKNIIMIICTIIFINLILMMIYTMNLSIQNNQNILNYQNRIDSLNIARKKLHIDTIIKYQFNDVEIK